MEIDNTPLFTEALLVMNNGATTTNTSWSTRIHYGDGSYFDPQYTVAINIERNYRDAFSDIKTITVTMGLGDYARLIYPNRLKLEVTLIKTAYLEQGSEEDVEGPIESERYSAVLLDGPKAPTLGQGSESNDRDALNTIQLVDIHFQLFDKAQEQIRVMMTGGVFRSCTCQDVLAAVLTNRALSTDTSKEQTLLGVDMFEADNKDKKGQIVVTHGTKLIDLPDFLQTNYGVYNSGIGSYIQNRVWYLYPLYNTSTFNKRKKTVTILVLPKRKYNNIERTFLLRGDSLTILVTSDTSFKDDSGTNYINTGNGVRFADAATMMENGITVTGNKASYQRNRNNTEVITDEGMHGINHAVVSAKRITANPFTEYSWLAAKRGGLFKANWQNSEPSLITPGMCAKVVYFDGDEVKQVYGVFHVIKHVVHRIAGFGSDRFVMQSVMSLFVNDQLTLTDQ